MGRADRAMRAPTFQGPGPNHFSTVVLTHRSGLPVRFTQPKLDLS